MMFNSLALEHLPTLIAHDARFPLPRMLAKMEVVQDNLTPPDGQLANRRLCTPN